MDVVGLDHVQVAMPKGREDEAREFYGRLLGLREIDKPPELARRGGLWFAIGTQQLHLGVEDHFCPARKAHPAFLVRDVGGLRDRVAEAGLEPVEDDLLPGYSRFYVTDPFGNRLEFLEPIRAT